DTGIVIWGDREFKVRDTVKVSGKTVHVLSGNSGGNHDIEKKCFLKVGAKQRSKKAANHTAAHLLHYALKKVLGEHVNQAGSYVSDSEVRFDFSHNSKLSPEQIKEIETTVTEAVVRDYPVKTEIMSSDEAVKSGAVALFGEKYGNTVRVVSAGSLSKELCGGTHAKATGNIGPFIIASEGSIASGVRRITALTGKNAYEFIRSKIDSAEKSASLLKTAPEEVPGKISEIQAEIKRLERENTSLQKDVFNSDFREKREKALIDIEGVDAAVLCLEDMPPKASKIFGDIVYDANSSGITLCAVITTDNKLSFFCAVSKDLTKRIKAGDIVKTAAAAAGGGGGGRPDRAQAGGRDISKSKEALEAGKEYISKCLG
ncbi:MAG: DHHA1 domain-containing protein, partial [Fibrobacterota bacterium]